MRLPRLPVSRRRHEEAVLNRREEAEARGKLADTMEAERDKARAERDKARAERDAALHRVVELGQERDTALWLLDHWYTAATDTAAQRNELYAAARKVHAEHGHHPHSPCDCGGCQALARVLDGHDRQERGSDFGGLAGLTREEYDRLRQAAGEADGDH